MLKQLNEPEKYMKKLEYKFFKKLFRPILHVNMQVFVKAPPRILNIKILV